MGRNNKRSVTPDVAYKRMIARYELDFLPPNFVDFPIKNLKMYVKPRDSFQEIFATTASTFYTLIETRIQGALYPDLENHDQVSYSSMLARNPALKSEALSVWQKLEKLDKKLSWRIIKDSDIEAKKAVLKLYYDAVTEEILPFLRKLDEERNKVIGRLTTDDLRPVGVR